MTDTPTLLLPGLLCDKAVWAPQTVALGSNGVRAVHGYRLATSIGEMAEIALYAAPPQFNLAGHSMGARVALEVYRIAPDRVKKLALLDTGVHPVLPGEKDKRMALLARAKSGGIEILVEDWLPPMVAPANRANPAMMEPMREMVRRGGVDGFEAQVAALLSRPSLDELLPQIMVPTLVAVGSEDQWSPPAQNQQIARAIPTATFEVFEGAGHMAPIEAGERVTQTLLAWMES